MKNFLTVIGKIPGVIWGVILGFSLNAIATWLQEIRAEKRQARAVRTLLSLEIDQNLEILRDFWNKMKGVDDSGQSTSKDYLRLALRLIELPLPNWSHKAWESQMSLLVRALKDQEIKQVHNFHTQLDAISGIRSTLLALNVGNREEASPALLLQSGLANWFTKAFEPKASQLGEECEQIVRALLDKGNPLKVVKIN
jgi:hypothetical protein